MTKQVFLKMKTRNKVNIHRIISIYNCQSMTARELVVFFRFDIFWKAKIAFSEQEKYQVNEHDLKISRATDIINLN